MSPCWRCGPSGAVWLCGAAGPSFPTPFCPFASYSSHVRVVGCGARVSEDIDGAFVSWIFGAVKSGRNAGGDPETKVVLRR